ncbi:hypothetical protein OBBRIDRAFT_118190 [Obba rivulosa]|uniref:BBC1/AIM3 cysteine proteinase-fold domain-containing protein n=1 Tax=Obba rivulosa TaxID=1052685 RepID=A0A8E2ANY3_9APHY|nr:hypothetical protein OBBRIDRAFT_118190 [Obba rivulosa]
MSDSSEPPKKVGSLRDRIAAFEKARSSPAPAPAPAPRPKSGGVSWKPKALSPPSSPAQASNDVPTPEHPGGIMSAADAKESITKGGSLKERMAALQGKGGFGGPLGAGTTPPIKPAVEKPKWKPPPVVATPADEHDVEQAPKVTETEGVQEKAEGGTHPKSPEEDEHAVPQEDSQGDPDPGEEERQRRAAIAARMARLGGARVGMGPPPVTAKKPEVRKPETHKEEEKSVENSAEAVASPPAESQLSEAEKSQAEQPSDYFQTTNASDSSLLSPDTGADASSSVRSPSMPVPAGPRRAAPPRRKAPKSPSPAPSAPEPTLVSDVIHESPAPLPGTQPASTELANAAEESGPHGDVESELKDPQEAEALLKLVQASTEEPSTVSTPPAPRQSSDTTAEAVLEKHVDREEESTATLAAEHAAESETTESAPGSEAATAEESAVPETPTVAEEAPVPVEEPEEEDEATRRKRIAERLAKSGGFNPFAGLPPTSPPTTTVERRSSLRKDSMDTQTSPVSSEPERRASLRKGSKDSYGAALEHRDNGRKGSVDSTTSQKQPLSPHVTESVKSKTLGRRESIGSVQSNVALESPAAEPSQDDQRTMLVELEVMEESSEGPAESSHETQQPPHVGYEARELEEATEEDEEVQQYTAVDDEVHPDTHLVYEHSTAPPLPPKRFSIPPPRAVPPPPEETGPIHPPSRRSTLRSFVDEDATGAESSVLAEVEIDPQDEAIAEEHAVPHAQSEYEQEVQGHTRVEAEEVQPNIDEEEYPPSPPPRRTSIQIPKHDASEEIHPPPPPPPPPRRTSVQVSEPEEDEDAPPPPPPRRTSMQVPKLDEDEDAPPPPPPRRTSMQIPKLDEDEDAPPLPPPRRTSMQVPNLDEDEVVPLSPPPPRHTSVQIEASATPSYPEESNEEQADEQVEDDYVPSRSPSPPLEQGDYTEDEDEVTPAIDSDADDNANELEVLDDSDGDPIDPEFYSPRKSPGALDPVSPPPAPERTHLPPLPPITSRPAQQGSIVPEDAQSHDGEQDAEQTPRKTIAERMAKLGGIHFGVPMPPPVRRPPPSAPAEEEQPEDTTSPTEAPEAEAETEQEPEEDEFARKQRIAARIAGMGGMRFGMIPTLNAPKQPQAQSFDAEEPRVKPSPAPPRPVPVPAPEAEEQIEETEASLGSDDGERIELEESEAEEVTHTEAEEEAPPVPNREGRRPAVPQYARPPPIPRGLHSIPAPPVPIPAFPPKPPARQAPAEPSFSYSPPPPPPPPSTRPAVLSHDTQADYVMVEEDDANDEPPPPPPPRTSRAPPRSALPPQPLPQIQSIPSVDFGGETDLSLSGQWSDNSTADSAPPPPPAKSSAPQPPTKQPSAPQPPTKQPSAPQPEVPRSSEDLMSQWGRIGVQIHEAAAVLFEKSKKTLVGDGSYLGFVTTVLRQVPNAKQPADPFESFGYLIYGQTASEVWRRSSDLMPGDVIVLQDAKFKGHKGLHAYNQLVGVGEPLVGIVGDYEVKKMKAKVFQANQHVGQQSVESISYRLDDLKSGTVKVFRVLEST